MCSFDVIDFEKTVLVTLYWVTRTVEQCPMCLARNRGPRTPPKTADTNLDCALVENTLFYTDAWLCQQNRIELVTRPGTRCTNDSYYECLARRFVSIDYSKMKSPGCSFDQICYPLSLPFDKIHQIPLCKTEEERVCYEQVIDELKKDQGEHCQKSCNSKEFQTQSVLDGLMKKIGKSNWARWKKENWDWNGSHPENSFIFEYTFEVPSDVRDLRSERPYKTVNMEYLVVSPMSLIGNVCRILFHWMLWIIHQSCR